MNDYFDEPICENCGDCVAVEKFSYSEQSFFLVCDSCYDEMIEELRNHEEERFFESMSKLDYHFNPARHEQI